MKTLHRLILERKAAAAIEFGITAPIILLIVLGILQLGQLFEARAGLKYSMDEASRYAGIYPRPSDSAIQARFVAKRFGLNSSLLSTSINHASANGVDYIDMSATYKVQPDFVFFRGPVVTLTEYRRTFQS